jgi:hypothetical protein
MRTAALVVAGMLLVGCGGSVGRTEGASTALPAPPLADGGDPGPNLVVEGRPSGFAHDRTGAVAAATTYLSSLHGLLEDSASNRQAAVGAMTADGAGAVADELDQAMQLLDGMVDTARSRNPDARVFVRSVPVAYSVNSFSAESASVEVWSVGMLVVEGETLVTEVWSTNRVDLVWQHDDWKLESWHRSVGPTPSIAATEPVAPTELLDAIEGWEGYRYVPAA